MHTSLPPRDAEWRSDAQLLAAYVAGGHCGPLAEVVRRHTPMVYAVARRVTNSAQDAEDIVQAVSMILVSQARKLLASPSIAGWLYQVARRAALDLRKSGARRQMRESQYARQRNPVANDRSNTAQQVDQETLQLLHDAISELPPSYQEAVILCHLERKTQQQAAIELGCSQRTISDRLYKASQLLHKILRRRGVTLTLAGVMGLLATEGAVAAATPAGVVSAGVAAAYAAAGQATAGVAVSTVAAALAKSVTAKMAALHAAKTVAGILAVLAVATTGIVGLRLWLKPAPQSVAAVAVAQKYPFDFRGQPNLSAMDIRNRGVATTLPGWATSLDPLGTRLVGASAGRTSPPARITRRIDGKPISRIEITASIRGPFAADGRRQLPLNARLAGFTLVAAGGPDETQSIPAPPAGDVRAREYHLRWVLTETEEGAGSWDVVCYDQGRIVQRFRATGQPTDLGIELALQPGAMAWLRNMSVRGTALK